MGIVRKAWVTGSFVVVGAIVACGGGPGGGGFGNGDGTSNDPTLGGGGGGGSGGTLGGGGGDGGADLSKCATASAAPSPVPVNLVFMFDKSGSMADASKWPSCVQGLGAFFADPSSKGLNASLQFFPGSPECTTATYQSPAVAMKALPDSSTFQQSMAAKSPGGGTPTLPALGGAIAYAQQIQQQHQGEKVAIVLVTDGEPNDCSSTVPAVAGLAATVAKNIPTYVIGVGGALQNLDAIAFGGGTGKATVVQTNNPQQIAQDFENALNTIRGLSLACEYKIPPAPNGTTIDYGKVNVVFTPTNAAQETLVYSQDCSNMSGWRYDDPKAPTKIQLCSGACNAVQKDKSGKIDVVFGCKTNGLGAN